MPDEALHSRLGSLVEGYAPASSDALAAHAVDGVVPSAVVAPDCVESLSATVKMASEQGYTVIPRGGGTKMDFGHPPTRADIVVSLARMNRIVSHEPADQTATAEAGITMAGLQAGLGERGQYLPLDPPHGDAGTLGGALATNASGVLRTSFGTARDMVIGVRVVQADGTIVRSGGRVVKNVAGYDLNKLYIGSLGTLGILAEVNLKLQPLPAAGKMIIGSMPGISAAAEGAFRVMDSDIMPSFLELADPVTFSLLARGDGVDRGNGAGSGGAQHDEGRHGNDRTGRGFPLIAGMFGTEETVDWQIGECERLLRETGAAGVIRLDGDAYRQALESMRSFPSGRLLPRGMQSGMTCRASVTPGEVEALYRLAEERCGHLSVGCGMLSHFASGHVAFVFYGARPFLEADFDGLAGLIEALRAASEHHGAFVLEHAPAALKERVGPWGSARGNLRLMEMLKYRFDPNGTLNPGRFVGGI